MISMNKSVLKYCFSFLLVLVVWQQGFAQNIPEKPNPPRLVNDLAGVMTSDQVARLEQKLVAYDDSTSNQVVVVTIRTLNNYPIEEFSTALFRKWGIGNKNTNNGILILAAIDDRQIRIETGYGLEGAIPDIVASQIIRNDIGPAFRAENYYEGLDKASTSVILAAAGEYKAPEGYADRGRKRPGTGSSILVIIIIIIILSMINRRGGGGGFMSRRGYRGWGPPVIFPTGGGWSGGGGGFGGGGFGGGGFGGFGGGSSGGGGASGSW